MMNILICDDMTFETSRLENSLYDSGLDVKIASVHSGYDALDYVHSGAAVDVCFLDILMPEMSGVALAERLREGGFRGEIIFLSTSNEYAAESYRVKAFSYLLKPLQTADVLDVLNELENVKKNGDVGGIMIKVSKAARFILFRDIFYVEVIQHYVYFRLLDGEEIRIYATFEKIALQILSDRRFAQCHRSYIVNMSEIASIGEREILMRGGKRIRYSRNYADIKKKFAKWIVGEV